MRSRHDASHDCSWRDLARNRLETVLLAYESACNVSELSLKEFNELASKAYPFGVRQRWPYKAWLAEMKVARKFFGLMQQGQRTAATYSDWSKQQLHSGRAKTDEVAPGQMRLLE